MSVQDYLQKLMAGNDLEMEEAEGLFNEILSGEMDERLLSAILVALAMKGESVNEIAGAVFSMRRYAIKAKAPEGAIDIVGTGGDGLSTFNISTTTAIVTAAMGVPVAKHGNKAVSSKSGSADVLRALGVQIDLPAEDMEKVLQDTNMAFFFAPLYHQAMKAVVGVRKVLKARTIFNALGPLVNPANVDYYLLGVYDKNLLTMHAAALEALSKVKTALVVHGDLGIDEIAITGKTEAFLVGKDIEKSAFTIDPKDFGMPYYDIGELRGGDALHNASALKAVLAGQPGAYRDAVLLNAAAAYTVVNYDQSKGAFTHQMHNNLEKAVDAIDSGKASKTLQSFIQASKEV